MLQAKETTKDANRKQAQPNVIIIYADDLGYGDVSCNGATKVKTPQIDRIAKEGLNFTDAHCSAATCTPSRVALLTGQYAFRTKAHILRGNAAMAIKPGTTTIASLFKSAGYQTGVVGKWHLGLGSGKKELDWNSEVKPGPLEIGFKYSFLIPATGDRVPCVYLENYRVVDLDPADPIKVSYGKRIGKAPSGKEIREKLKQKWSHGHNQTVINGIGRIGWMTGGKKALWKDEDMADVISNRATAFIERNKKKPFFLYFSTHDIHVPRVPHSRFKGKSGMGPRGDAIVQLDFCVGEILKALDKHNLTKNTIVIFSSDNGPVLDDGYVDQANEKLGDHKPAGPFRAGKYSLFEGGTRVPMMIRWPGVIKPASKSDALFGQVDLPTSLAKLCDIKVPQGSCKDSRDHSKALIGKDSIGRPHLIHEARGLALRMGKWKYIPAKKTRDKLGPWKSATFKQGGALFDLSKNVAEQKNLASKHPEVVKKMAAKIKAIRENADQESK